MTDLNVVTIIQARMASSRLPGKVLLDLGGQPVLAWVVERCRQAKTVNQVVVATTGDPADDPIVALCTQRGWPTYRGSQFDVLDRFYQAARVFSADVIVRVTADCPLIDPQVIDALVEEHLAGGWDFTANRLPPPRHRTWPIGLDAEVCSMAGLEQVWKDATLKFEREHVMPYFYDQDGRFRVKVVEHDPDYGHMRWTLDTPEDYDLLRELVGRLEGGLQASWLDVLRLFERDPQLTQVNASVRHKNGDEFDARMESLSPGALTPLPSPTPWERGRGKGGGARAEITFFTAPKPFHDPHIATIQRNAIRSWRALGPQVEVILLGDEEGLAETAVELGVTHIPHVERTPAGTPLVSSMFRLAREHSTSPLLCCINADILLLPEIIPAAQALAQAAPRFLAVGQRWDLDVREDLDFSAGWDERLRERVSREGKLHRAAGSDYFIFPRDCFSDMPAFAIGRAGWDNWMIYAGRSRGWPVVDATADIQVVHQNHDYSHLPGGQPHYRHPETYENVRLAGGRRAIFELPDASHRLIAGKLIRPPLTWKRFWREAEIFPLVKLHSYPLAQLFYVVFHPVKAWRERGKRKV